jgi:hypothetical protein
MAKPKRQTANPENGSLDLVKQQLAAFCANNPQSSIEAVRFPMKGIGVTKPGGDQSIQLFLPSKANDLIDALNNIYLPEKFSGIWHLDSKLFEVIFTVYEVEKEVSERSFEVKHRARSYDCYFGDASPRLLLLAEHYYAVGPATTDYRNLDSFSDFVMSKKNVRGFPTIRNARPLCFWIKGIQAWDTDLVLDLARHLNFYMAYYDVHSPQVLVHSTTSEELAIQPEPRYREGGFPKQITIRPIQDNLLSFWRAATEGDSIQAFLNNYLVVEYAAFFYVGDNIKRSLRKFLSAPNATDNVEALTEQVLEAVGEDKMEPYQKFDNVLQRCVDAALVWRELESNRDFFSGPVQFDGGFSLEPILTKTMTEKDFAVSFATVFGSKVRSIRNALAHGKEQRTMATITPTTENFRKLEPWVRPLAVAAREVMIYRTLA